MQTAGLVNGERDGMQVGMEDIDCDLGWPTFVVVGKVILVCVHCRLIYILVLELNMIKLTF